jgi:hypothetical protein
VGGLFGESATFGNPSFAAEYCAPVLLLLLAVFLLGRRTHALALGAPVVAFLVVTRSRADWLGLVFGAAVLGFFELAGRKGWKLRPRLVTAALLLLVLALPYLIQALPVPALGRSDTVRIRELARASTLSMALDHPVSGVGLEGFADAYHDYRDPEEYRLSLRRDVGFPHNLPLSVFAEAGVPGFLFLLFFLWTTLVAGVRTLVARPDDGIAFGALGAVVALLVSAQLSAPLRHPSSALLFFVLSGILVARRPKRYVAVLGGRYRRLVPVLVLAAPIVVLAALTPSRLLADRRLQLARSRMAELSGGIDEGVADLLRASVEAEPTPHALWKLAFYHGGLESADPAAERACARDYLDRLFAISPRHPRGRVERARLLIAEGKAEDGLALLRELLELRPGDPDASVLAARALSDLGRHRDALEALGPALSEMPENWHVLLLRARVLTDLGETAEVARALDPIAAEIHAGREFDEQRRAEFDRLRVPALLAAMKEKSLDDTRLYAREISEVYPGHVKRVAMMAARIGTGDRERGLAILEELAGPAAWFYRAVVLAQHGRLDDAMDALRESGDFATPALLRSEPGLAPLRSRADFRALLR